MSADDERGRRLLDRARKAAPVRKAKPRRPPADEQQWSGAAGDERDPALLGASIDAFVAGRQWEDTLRKVGLPSRWPQIVGPAIAEHCRPDRLHDGELVCVAESSAWASEITLRSAEILAKIAEHVGAGVVVRLRVHGPTAPSWRHGPLRVPGRGPRDTYG